MKNTQITVIFHQGLPNFTHKEASVTVVADEGESLNVSAVISQTLAEITAGFGGKTVAPRLVPAAGLPSGSTVKVAPPKVREGASNFLEEED